MNQQAFILGYMVKTAGPSGGLEGPARPGLRAALEAVPSAQAALKVPPGFGVKALDRKPTSEESNLFADWEAPDVPGASYKPVAPDPSTSKFLFLGRREAPYKPGAEAPSAAQIKWLVDKHRATGKPLNAEK